VAIPAGVEGEQALLARVALFDTTAHVGCPAGADVAQSLALAKRDAATALTQKALCMLTEHIGHFEST
jgi:hypothetical protein